MKKKIGALISASDLKAISVSFGKFLAVVLATAIGSYCTYLVNQRTSGASRKTDAMIDVYFGSDNWTSSMSPLEYQLRQSFNRAKFAVFADNSSLRKLDGLLKSDKNCKDGRWSDACLELTAEQLLIQHQSLQGGNADDAAAFLRIVRHELALQRSALLAETVNRYWISFPLGLDLRGDDIPFIRSRKVPDDFMRSFPTSKYVILVNLAVEKGPPRQDRNYLTCVALVGLTYQPVAGDHPALPTYNTSAFKRVNRASSTAERDCVLQAADQAIAHFFETPIATLKQYIDHH